MSINSKMKDFLNDPLKKFRMLQRIIALVCIAIPVVFRITDRDEHYPRRVTLMTESEMKSYLQKKEVDSVDTLLNHRFGQFELKVADTTYAIDGLGEIIKDRFGFRCSLSDYAISSRSYLFGMMYMMAALLYIYNGFVYMVKRERLTVAWNGPLVNLFIGFSLIGVILHPLGGNGFLHSFFSILFFVGNVFFLLFIAQEEESQSFKKMRIAMGLATILFFIGHVLGLYSLLWGESLSLAVIAIYLFIVAGRVHYK